MLAEVEARLKSEVAALKLVDGAAAFAALKKAPQRQQMPAAYVFPVSDRASPNAVAMAVRQKLVERIGVALVTTDLKDPRGEAAATAIEPLRKSIRAALLGWVPEAGYSPIIYGNGRTAGFWDSAVWWEMDFITDILISDT